jgi:hypothetical protein
VRRGTRTWLAVAGVTLLHAGLSLGLLWGSAVAALSRIDTGTPPTAGERLMGLATTILWYPVAGPIMSASWVRPSGLWAYLLLIVNSALWATLIVLGVRALRARRQR